MSYFENAKKFYWDRGMSCAEAILLGGNETYDLGLKEEDAVLFAGFGGGIGCGKICGCAAAAVGILGKLFSGREDYHDIRVAFVEGFEKALGCDTINCDVLSATYKTEEDRCIKTVKLAADYIEEFIARYR